MQKLIEKYKDIIPYAIFGILTTLVNIGSYWGLAHLLHLPIMASTIFAWIMSVLFAYLTNRKCVFHSEADTVNAIGKEIASFFGCRLATGILDWVSMFAFVDIIHLDDMWVKVVTNVVVIILNYIASKYVIFKHRKNGE